MRLLCASNLHLGRRPAGLPDHAGIDPARLSATATWTRLADAAVAHRVDAILLAGDTIDRENPHFEPAGALRQGLGTLEREDIPVIAIAGDEDTTTLPRVVRLLQHPTLHLLDDTRPSIEIGPEGNRITVTINPDTEAKTDADTGHRQIGLLHASLTDGHAPDGTVNPVRPDDLASQPAVLWVLGAQREPDIVIHEDTTIIEPGAAWPASPDETGPHGAILVDLSDDGHITCDIVPLAPVQFVDADIDLDLTGLDGPDAIEAAIVESLTTALDDALRTDTERSLAVLVCTLHLSGATSHHADIPALTDDLSRTIAVQHDGVTATLGSVEIDTRPDIDIASLLNRPDPVGEVARLLAALDDNGQGEPSPAQDALIQRAADRLVAVHRSRVFAGVAHDPAPDTDLARATLRREAWTVLDALVRQRGVD